jgi:hypothetical protein
MTLDDAYCLIKEPKNFSSGLLLTCIVMVHNSESCSQNNVTKASRWEDILNPLLNILIQMYECSIV